MSFIIARVRGGIVRHRRFACIAMDAIPVELRTGLRRKRFCAAQKRGKLLARAGGKGMG
jgi:hypothetical protein